MINLAILSSLSPIWLIAGSYALVLFGLSLLGSHRLALTVLAWSRSKPPESPRFQAESAPSLLLQCPLYNEASVIERLLDAVSKLRYPRDKLFVQVLDDSSDETVALVAAKVEALKAEGLQIEHVRRDSREGFKAGALAYGMELRDTELLAIFDADFVPAPDFLEQTVPYFAEDPTLGLVQARWGHLNRGRSLLTRLQAILLDGHFRVEQLARSGSGRFFNFNGTAGVWRRQAIDDAGGWDGDTLTEDLDLSLRAQILGWRFQYLDHVQADAELPPSLIGFRGQQHRWVKGSAENLRKLFAVLWTAPELASKARLEASFQLTLNIAYILVCALALLSVPLVAWGLPVRKADLWLDLGHLLLVFFATGSVCVFYLYSQRGRGFWAQLETLLLLPVLLAFGIGLALSNSRAYLSGLLGHKSAFVRTPKEGNKKKHYRAQQDWLGPCFEVLLGLYVAFGLAIALEHGRTFALPFLMLLASGFLGFGLATFWELWKLRRRH